MTMFSQYPRRLHDMKDYTPNKARSLDSVRWHLLARTKAKKMQQYNEFAVLKNIENSPL